ncbi:hypothetical protein YC2023_010847 [Brassica napus]
MVYQRVEGMQTVSSKQQAEVVTTQLHKQPTEASREDFSRLIIAKIDALLSKLLILKSPTKSSTPPISPRTPDPPDFNAAEKIKPSSLSSLTPKTRKSKRHIPLKYSCDEIYERMEKGLCIFCEARDTPGHHDLKHKGVEILMIESDDQSIVTESEPSYEESLVESDEFLTNTVMKVDAFSELLECFTSDLQIVDAAGQKQDKNKNYAEDIVSFSLGRKIEDMVGKQFHEADRVWEPGGFIAKPATQSQGIDKFQKANRHQKLCRNVRFKLAAHWRNKRWVNAVDLFHSVDTSCWNQFLKQQKCPKSWNFKYKHGEYMVKSFLENARDKKLQVVQQRPHVIRCSRDKNAEKILSRPLGDMDAWFQEIVTTVFGTGVSLKCLDKYFSHDQVLGLTTKTLGTYIQNTTIFIPLAKETREWSMQSALKIQV